MSREQTLELGFRAFDPHELLCHFVSVHFGYYEELGVRARLVDLTFLPDRAPSSPTAQVSCGAALMRALRGGDGRIVLVVTDQPLFWLYVKDDVTAISDLEGSRIASYPSIAPPHHFLQLVLAAHKLDPVTEVDFVAARDDVARVGLLIADEVRQRC